MIATADSYYGVGIYSVSDAARLTGMSQTQIRHWMNGYSFKVKAVTRQSHPVLERQLPIIDGQTALGFLDLIEIRVIAALLKEGFSLHAIRQAHTNAMQSFRSDHPFAAKKVFPAMKGIFSSLDDGMINIRDGNQFEFDSFVKPYLKDLEFGNDDLAVLWWPLGVKDKRVVIDPQRRFGKPVVTLEGIPTKFLYQSYQAEGNSSRAINTVADWYAVEPKSVRGAIAFEKRFAA